jgi:chemotaxis protein methyltransferase CheR
MAHDTGVSDREFHFTDGDFRAIVQMIGDRTGIVLTDAKRQMVYSRLARRLRALAIPRFADYLAMVQEDEAELVNFVNALTTNLTAFFREKHHFNFLQSTLLPELMRRHERDRRLRIWSAGCSTGEEPYSIAMVVRESVPLDRGWDVKILATDLDSNVVAHAKRGVYNAERVTGIEPQRLKRWFYQGQGQQSGSVRVRPELQELITFKQLNLMQSWPFKGPFDFIFCRNVVIYFSKDTQRQLVERYASVMVPDAHLFLGHSESLFKVTDRFKLLGQTIYQRVS